MVAELFEKLPVLAVHLLAGRWIIGRHAGVAPLALQRHGEAALLQVIRAAGSACCRLLPRLCACGELWPRGAVAPCSRCHRWLYLYGGLLVGLTEAQTSLDALHGGALLRMRRLDTWWVAGITGSHRRSRMKSWLIGDGGSRWRYFGNHRGMILAHLCAAASAAATVLSRVLVDDILLDLRFLWIEAAPLLSGRLVVLGRVPRHTLVDGRLVLRPLARRRQQWLDPTGS